MRIISYITPYTYAVPAFTYHLIRDAPALHGVALCNASDPGCPESGFTCPDSAPDVVCVGATGEQVLQSLSEQYGAIVDVNDIVLKHLGIIVALGIALRATFFCVLWFQSRSCVELRPEGVSMPVPVEPVVNWPTSELATEAAGSAESKADMDNRAWVEIEGMMAPAAEEALGVQLIINDVSVQLKQLEGAEEGQFLLKNVSARCASGDVLSVMGPSGAGKTTLLNLLACEETAGRTDYITGAITLNGNPLDEAVYRDHCAYMPQQDYHLFTFLSCEAHVYYAVALYQGGLSAGQGTGPSRSEPETLP